jgi:hypothetical protein
MTNNTTKAQIIEFLYAGFTIQGLLLPDGQKRIALTQIRHLILGEKNYNIKQLEALSGLTLSAEKVLLRKYCCYLNSYLSIGLKNVIIMEPLQAL